MPEGLWDSPCYLSQHTHTHVGTHTHTHIHSLTRSLTHSLTQSQRHTHTHVNTQIHTHTHSFTYSLISCHLILFQICTRTHTHTIHILPIYILPHWIMYYVNAPAKCVVWNLHEPGLDSYEFVIVCVCLCCLWHKFISEFCKNAITKNSTYSRFEHTTKIHKHTHTHTHTCTYTQTAHPIQIHSAW